MPYSIARAYSGDTDVAAELDPLAARDIVAAEAGGDARTRAARLRLLLRKMGDLVAVPARVARDGGADLPGYGIHLERLDAESRGLDRLDPGAVNDILFAALHLTVALCNFEHGVRCARVSVLMPVNLRPEGWRGDVVANLSVLARTLTKPGDRSLHKVLAAVVAQAGRMDQERTLTALLELIGQDSRLPAPLRRGLPVFPAITGNRLVDTAALAYLGRLDPPPLFGPEAGETPPAGSRTTTCRCSLISSVRCRRQGRSPRDAVGSLTRCPPRLSVVVLGLLLRDLDRLDQVLQGRVEVVSVEGSTPLQATRWSGTGGCHGPRGATRTHTSGTSNCHLLRKRRNHQRSPRGWASLAGQAPARRTRSRCTLLFVSRFSLLPTPQKHQRKQREEHHRK